MAEKVINESDSNEQKVKAALSTAPAGDSGQSNTESEGAQLIDVGGMVSPESRTANSELPQLPDAKKKRGRPAGGKNTKKPATKNGSKVSASDEVPDYIQAAALYNMVLVAGCKMVSDEFEQSETMQQQTIKAACDYFESIDVTLPAWAGLLAVSGMNIAAALKTPSGKGKVSGLWAKARAWWELRKG